MAKYTDLRVTYDDTRGCVHWNAEGKRYHLWLYSDDKPEGWIHQNDDAKVKGFGHRSSHRALDATNKTNSALLTLIFAEIAAGDMIGKAKAAWRAERDAKEAETTRAHEEYKAVQALQAEAIRIALRGGFAGVAGLERLHEIAERVRALHPLAEGG
jgi:hypothetical protein